MSYQRVTEEWRVRATDCGCVFILRRGQTPRNPLRHACEDHATDKPRGVPLETLSRYTVIGVFADGEYDFDGGCMFADHVEADSIDSARLLVSTARRGTIRADLLVFDDWLYE